jgi:hypothetical protein
VLATAFPPFYDVRNGSHLAGYVCRLNWLNLVFSPRQITSAARIHLDARHPNWREYLREIPSDKLWNLNGITVRGFHRLLRDTPLQVQDIHYMGHHDRRISAKSRGYRRGLAPLFALFEFAARAPLLRELWCSRICAVLRKPPAAAVPEPARPVAVARGA